MLIKLKHLKFQVFSSRHIKKEKLKRRRDWTLSVQNSYSCCKQSNEELLLSCFTLRCLHKVIMLFSCLAKYFQLSIPHLICQQVDYPTVRKNQLNKVKSAWADVPITLGGGGVMTWGCISWPRLKPATMCQSKLGIPKWDFPTWWQRNIPIWPCQDWSGSDCKRIVQGDNFHTFKFKSED